MKRIIKVLVVCVTLVLLFGCSKDNKITGKWEYVDGNKKLKDIYYVFNKDNTGTYRFYTDESKFTYKIDNNKIKIKYEKTKTTREFTYIIDKDVLTMKNSLNEDVKYKKSK